MRQLLAGGADVNATEVVSTCACTWSVYTYHYVGVFYSLVMLLLLSLLLHL